MKHWVDNKEIDLPSERFFDEIESVCKKYGLSISHEDSHGSFVVEIYDTNNMEWLRNANFTKQAAEQTAVK